MSDLTRWQRIRKRPLESYSKTWLGSIAVAVVAVLIGTMLAIHAFGAGYRHYTAEFLQAASLRPGNPITVAGIPVGEVTSMELVGDHVEAGLKIKNDVALGKDSKASIRVTTILGSRYLALYPDGNGSLANNTFDLSHTDVPYDLQAALQDATTTFEQVDSDRFAQSLTVLGKQMQGLPEVVPQAIANIDSLSSIIAQRRDQLGQLLKSTEQVSNTLRRQQAGIGNLVNQSQDLLGHFAARRAVFHSLMRSITTLVETMNDIVVNDRAGVDGLLKDVHEFTDLMARHDDLLRSLLQVTPVFARQAANLTGDADAVSFNAPNALLVDSWMCALSGRAKQFGMIPYFKDCK
ncbi:MULTISPECIES: MlaD family protein [Mycobacterium]|uniref:Mce family protein n=1 Tax=Mycobacterium kiyosense TaxID=2871094 RepID=A0A9P3Q446_9MYCO|nr:MULTISPECIES: MlaD family protein [Mycobacterium]BDB41496.1 putative Mce family protein [Mycobacterium kiyosense]BDE15202.1 putative Mce family protein [Mycobacterium sp. 20KCMC460]GLB81684.1 putative Mce family protein [Mycobacterium kiyosense]GLB87536.1 putative Mce family protein [Mycobacterium kiyosense]GLB94264.1 putative Mce family protein [Mycobacterium kiyosense]